MVLQLLKLPNETVKSLVEENMRAQITRFIDKESIILGEIEPIVESVISDNDGIAIRRTVVGMFEEYAKINKNISKELITNISSIDDISNIYLYLFSLLSRDFLEIITGHTEC